MILEALTKTKWNCRQAAIELAMPKSTLHDRVKKYGLFSQRPLVTNDAAAV